MLREWFDYVLTENDAYNNAAVLLILTSITKELKPNNDKLPPVLNKRVLADCMYEINNKSKADKNYHFDFNKMYETKLQTLYFEDTKVNNGNTGWILIPSEINDSENFKSNVEKLKALSHKNWCTKSFNAEPYLRNGDFHVYLENGQPKLGVRFVGDEIQEIQGEQNNGKIPFTYFEKMKQHISENNLQLTQDAIWEIKDAEQVNKEVQKIKNDLKDAIKNNDVKTIFEYFGTEVKENEDGYLTIFSYEQPSELFAFKDCGIDENILFEKVKIIEDNAHFIGPQLTDLGNLESIGGDAYFSNSHVTNLGNLESIDGNVYFSNSKVANLGNLESIGGDVDFSNSHVTNLGNLKSIGGDANFRSSRVTDLGNLESIGGMAVFKNSPITNLGNLESIDGEANFRNSRVTDLGNLKSIGGDADFRNSQVTNLGKLESIGGDAKFRNSQVIDLGNLESIGRDADFRNSQVINLGKLKSIGRDAIFSNSQIANLRKLESIAGAANFCNSQVTDLGNLESIGGEAFIESQEEYLGESLRKLTTLYVL